MSQWHWPAGHIVLAFVSLLPGCAATEHAAAVPYSVTFNVSADANPDLNRKPAPIVLKVFQLKGASAFEGADFFSLQNKPEGALGGDLLGVDRVILRPGESRTLRFSGNVAANTVGVVAEYRLLEQNRWKLTVALPQPKQLNFYRFWQTAPREMKVTIAVRSGGLALAGDTRGGL